jgi:hypothetical protein
MIGGIPTILSLDDEEINNDKIGSESDFEEQYSRARSPRHLIFSSFFSEVPAIDMEAEVCP